MILAIFRLIPNQYELSMLASIDLGRWLIISSFITSKYDGWALIEAWVAIKMNMIQNWGKNLHTRKKDVGTQAQQLHHHKITSQGLSQIANYHRFDALWDCKKKKKCIPQCIKFFPFSIP